MSVHAQARTPDARNVQRDQSFWRKLWRQHQLLVLSLPVLMVIVFSYFPIWGWLIAFQNYIPSSKISFWDQEWVGFANFVNMFKDAQFYRGLRNSLGIGILKIITSYVFTLMLAVMINEVKNNIFKRTVQTVSYLPHFVSWVVAANLIFVTFSPDGGIVNTILLKLGLVEQSIAFMGKPELFWVIVAMSEVWKSAGYGAIVYLSAMTSIDPALYESADIDGAGRFTKIFHITLPSIAPTIKIMLVLSIGRLLSVGFEQVYLLRTASTMETGTTLEVYIYEFAMRYAQFSKGTAMSIFNSLVSVVLIMGSNWLAKLLDGEGIV